MAIPTWTPGEVLASADVNSWFVPLAVYRTADATHILNTTLVNDPVLFLPVAANGIYYIHGRIRYSGSGTGGIKLAFTAPAGSALDWTCFGVNLSNNLDFKTSHVNTLGGNAQLGVISLSNPESAMIWGLLTVGGTPGNLQLQYAEAVTDGVNGSYTQANSCLLGVHVG